MKGRLITFEGIDGSGKSTQLRLVRKYLVQKGFSVLTAKDPGGTGPGEKIRRILLEPERGTERLDNLTELFLYLASRSVLVSSVIKPALDKGMIVLCDRFTDSTIAYQGFGRKLPLGILNRVCPIASRGLKPDLTFLIDVSPETGLSRVRKADRIESLGLAFQRRVRAGFLDLAAREPERFRVIKSGGSPQETSVCIIKQLNL